MIWTYTDYNDFANRPIIYKFRSHFNFQFCGRYIYLALIWCMHNIVWIKQYHEIYSSFLFPWMLHSVCLFYIASYSTRLAYILVSCCFNMISLVGMQLCLRYYHAFSNIPFIGGVHSHINFGNWIRWFYNASF